MTTKNIISSCLLLLAYGAGVTGCDNFLSEPPSKTSTVVPSTTEHLDALLARHASFYTERNRNTIYATDDYGLSTDIWSKIYPSNYFNNAMVQFACWDTEFLAFDADNYYYWPGEYKKIFIANMVLQNLSVVSGPETDKARLRAEAYLTRAYSYFNLVNTYCLPYTEATKDELGLPLKQSTSFEETSIRSRLGDIHALIEADLQEALQTTTHLEDNGEFRPWRGNIGAANAVAARYYLSRSNYSEALKYANAALTEYNTLIDYNTEMRYSTKFSDITVDGNTIKLQYPYTWDNSNETDFLFWKEFYYVRILHNALNWYIPSEALLDTYGRDAADLRYRYHIVEDYAYRVKPTAIFSYPAYVFFYDTRIPSGPTVAEMILTKAECQARQNNVSEAMATVNILRAKRMDNTLPANQINLTAANREEAVKQILAERRRELPFSARWMDIRRFNTNDDAFDDVSLTRTFYPYTSAAVLQNEAPVTYKLEKGSRRFALPIPNSDIISSGGKLQQNTY